MQTTLGAASAAIQDTVILPGKLQQLLRNKVSKIRMFPDVAALAIEVTKDPNASIAEFTNVVERDVMLASDILKIANSVLYSQGKPSTSLKRAVVRIGFRQCRNMIVTASMYSLMQQAPVREAGIRDALSRHSTLTSAVAAGLNRSLGLDFAGEEFAAGLLHDIGRILLAGVASELSADWNFADFHEDDNLLQREAAALGTTHCMVGMWFGVQNKLPQEFLDVIAYHHRPAKAPQSQKLVALIALADQMANYIQRTGSTEGFVQEANESTDILELNGLSRVANKINEISGVLMADAIADADSLTASK